MKIILTKHARGDIMMEGGKKLSNQLGGSGYANSNVLFTIGFSCSCWCGNASEKIVAYMPRGIQSDRNRTVIYIA